MTRRGMPVSSEAAPAIGSIDWLFREYRQSKAYIKKVGIRSRTGYEWAMRAVCNTDNKKGIRIGTLPIRSITPSAADSLYEKFITTDDGEKLRRGEKLTVLCRKAWRVVHRLFPAEFAKDIPNPWPGTTMKTRVVQTKPAATRAQVYAFARGCVERGEPEFGAAAVIAFEWLQRPENVIAGHVEWTGRGPPMILRAITTGKGNSEKVISKPYSFSGMQKIVQRMRKEIGLPVDFTLDACRHGGMTELEEAELTHGQGRALSAHKTKESYAGYAKRTAPRMLAATRKRHAHALANQAATSIQNGQETAIQNGKQENTKSA